jgi:hypothetical protein
MMNRLETLRQFVRDNPNVDFGDVRWNFDEGDVGDYWVIVGVREIASQLQDVEDGMSEGAAKQELIAALKLLVSLLDMPEEE